MKRSKNKSNNYGGVSLEGSHAEKVALSTVYADGSSYTHDREGKVFGNIGVKETSTGRTSQSASAGVGGELGCNFKIKITTVIDKSTRLYVQGDMSGNVDHKGTSFTDEPISTENNAVVGVEHNRSWTEGLYTERDQNHKIKFGSELDHNLDN